jgi:hypothetical protein
MLSRLTTDQSAKGVRLLKLQTPPKCDGPRFAELAGNCSRLIGEQEVSRKSNSVVKVFENRLIKPIQRR